MKFCSVIISPGFLGPWMYHYRDPRESFGSGIEWSTSASGLCFCGSSVVSLFQAETHTPWENINGTA